MFPEPTSCRGFVRLELPCRRGSPALPSPDPEPLWTMDDLVSELRTLEERLGSPSPLKAPAELMTPVGRGIGLRGQRFVMSALEDEYGEGDEGGVATTSFFDRNADGKSEGRLVGGTRFSCGDIELSESEDSDSDIELQTEADKLYLMGKKVLEEDILFELESEQQLRVQEEVRSKLASLEASQKSELERSAYARSRLDKFIEGRLEIDKRLDQQYQRKIAEVLDSHLSAIQRDHEQRSLVEERRIRDDAALEEAKKKALFEEKMRQERAKVEAEARVQAAKLAEETQRAALEAARKANAEAAQRTAKEAAEKEAAEREAAKVTQASANEVGKKESLGHKIEETKDGSSLLQTKNIQSRGIKVLAAATALKEDENKRKIYNEVAEKANQISQKDLDRYGRQIFKHIRQITGTVENVRDKANALVKIISEDPTSVSVLIIAKKVVSLCEDPIGSFQNTAFACGQVIVLVTSKVPALMNFLLAEFHRACVYTVPKHLQPSDQALQNKEYWRLLGYHEEDGKIESSDSYLIRVQSYMKLYAAITQTEIGGMQNPHGLKEGWAWLARFLNTLPANRSTAYALDGFLRMAGFALHRKYKSQFMKIMNVISSSFLPALRERGYKKMGEIIKRLEQYLDDKVYLKEPEGWRLETSLLSKELV